MTNFLFVVFKLEILKEIAILKRDRYRIFHENSYYFRYLFKKVKILLRLFSLNEMRESMEKKQLKREITTFGALSTVMGTVIGAGVFFKAASVVGHAQSASLAIFAWVLGGALTICAGLTSAELATAIPETGGAVKYIEYTYGKLAGFLLGWAQSIIDRKSVV